MSIPTERRQRRTAGSLALTACVLSIGGCNTADPVTVVASVSISPAAIAVAPHGVLALTAVAKDANGNLVGGRPVVWSSSDTTVATITSFGVLHALSMGVTAVTAVVDQVAGVDSAVIAPRVLISRDLPITVVGDTTQLFAEVLDADSVAIPGSVSWTSDNSSIATVSSVGIVHALQPGLARIIASSQGGSGYQDLSVINLRNDMNREIAFLRDRTISSGSSDRSLWVLGMDSLPPRLLSDSADKFMNFDWSPDGSQLVYGLTTSGARTGTYVGQFGSSSEQRVSTAVAQGLQWSPDGAHLACTFAINMQIAVVVLRPDGSNADTIAQGGALDWSPDGRQVIHSLPAGGGFGFGIARADGSADRIVGVQSQVTGARWSPDGKRIFVFGPKMWMANADGSNQVAFCPAGLGCVGVSNADWSPDGQRLVLDQGGLIWIVSVGGGTAIPITTACASCTSFGAYPRWSPDGTAIAFANSTDPLTNGAAIWVVNADGTNPRPLMTSTQLPIRGIQWRK